MVMQNELLKDVLGKVWRLSQREEMAARAVRLRSLSMAFTCRPWPSTVSCQ
ncbi:transposase IS3/family protein [Roseibium sp. TrichSKD4]|nr:transposase IS3/family protein [Roseibium sp. TrichSKD4]